MNEVIERKFWICQTDDGTYLAASTESPRFCFAGASEEEAVDKAVGALDAYLSGEFKPIVREQRASKELYRPRPIRVQIYTPKELATA